MLALVREGRLDAEIAVRLGVPIGDVKERIERIIRKLHFSERRDLLRPPEELPAPDPTPEAEGTIDATGGVSDLPVRSRRRGSASVAGVAVLAAVGVATAMWTWSGDRAPAEPAEDTAAFEDSVIRLADQSFIFALSGTPGVFILTPSQSATPTPTPPGALVNGIFMPEFTFTSSEAFPESLVLYVFNPGEPERQGAGLRRVYRLADGTHYDRIFPTGDTPGYLMSAAATPDASDIVVAVCSRGSCYGPGSQTTFYRSRDGGATWQAAFVLDRGSGVWAVANGRVLVSQEAEDSSVHWLLSESGALREVSKPQVQLRLGPERPILDSRGGVRWIAGGALLEENRFQTTVLPGYPLLTVQPMPDGLGWVAGWSDEKTTRGPRFVAATGPGGEVMGAYSVTTGAIIPRAWPRPTLGAGNMVFVSGAFGGTVGGGESIPAIINMATGTLQVMFDPFRGDEFKGEPNEVVAAVFAAIVRVNTPGDCLYIRSGPSSDAGSLDCVPHGGLLISVSGGLRAGGRADDAGKVWHPVRTLAGIEGWASAEYLE